MCRAMLAAALAACLVSTAIAQGQKPTFEVASIRPSKSELPIGTHNPQPGRFTATGMDVVELISLAYGIPPYRIMLPARVPSERYDIQATYPVSSTGGFGVRLQRLLEDRFALRVHRETRDLPIYVLVRSRTDGRLGPDLLPMDACTDPQEDGMRCGSRQFPGPGVLAARETWSSMGQFISDYLGQVLRRIVLDKTGLTGWFTFRLEWDPQSTWPAQLAIPERPSLFGALEQQLGLKLESTRGPVEVLVIESVQQPTDN
jgi:uncharacterized protein (TIGR03435 family)